MAGVTTHRADRLGRFGANSSVRSRTLRLSGYRSARGALRDLRRTRSDAAGGGR